MEQQEVSVDFSAILKQAQERYDEAKNTINNERLNILILGKTGVGKSTLINAIFGKELAKAGQGKPVTQEIESYTDDKGLVIYDSPGLELAEDKKIQIEEFIRKQEKKEADEQIHIAWFCISESGRRVEETEKELYEFLKGYKFPTLVVITKAQQDKDDKGEKFSDRVKEVLGTDEVFRVRALEVEDDEGEIKKIMGIKELTQKSYDLLPEGQKAAFARKQEYDKKMKKEQCIKDAKALITKYSVAAAASCGSPIPFSDIALILPIQCGMIIHISNTYGLKLDFDGAKKVAVALAGVCAVGFGVRALAGNLIKFVPVIGSIGGAVINGTIAATTTKAMGEVYLAWLDDNFDDILDNIVDLDNLNFGKYESLAKSLSKS